MSNRHKYMYMFILLKKGWCVNMKKNISLAEYYGIPIEKFEEFNVLNPNLKQNTNMFIDPVLLKDSQYEIFSKKAYKKYIKFFENLYDQMKAYTELPEEIKTESQKDLISKFFAKGIPYLCLGYSSSGKRDGGIGYKGAKRIFKKAEKLFSLDIDKNPAIFSVVYMLTEKIGPDYISDMTAQIIIDEIKEFTQTMAPKLGLKTSRFKNEKYELPVHPYLKKPILLLPEDILNLLPIDINIEDIYNGYHPNETIRKKVNEYIGNIFKDYQTKWSKKALQDMLTKCFVENSDVLADFTKYARTRSSKHYDFSKDKKGYYFAQRFRKMFNLDEIDIKGLGILDVIDETIKRFKDKIDNNNDIKRNLLWMDNKPRNEKCWQQAFHLSIFQKLEDAGLNVDPEYQTGRGPIDFCISKGVKCRILIEIKLSKNNPIKGLEHQLEVYKKCVENVKAYFICFNLEEDNNKYNKLNADLERKRKELNLNTEIIIIDGRINKSGSNEK